VLLLVAWSGHHFRLLETTGYFWVLAVVALLAALALLMAAFAFSRIWAFGDGGGRDFVAGCLMALIVLLPYGVVAWLMLSYPPLRDISTDLDAPPTLPTAVERTADMNMLAPPTPGEQRLQAESYPQITGRRYSAAFDETIAAVETVLAQQGWRIVDPPATAAGAGTEVTIGAVANPLVLDIPADVSIRIAVDGDTTLVDMRSASRYGRHDLGDNARRITAFLTELDLQVAGQTSPASTAE
jgi:uncharacterized protein (DUF1499 family)